MLDSRSCGPHRCGEARHRQRRGIAACAPASALHRLWRRPERGLCRRPVGKLGIAAAVAAKVKLTSGPVAELVARGEAELGMQQIIAILPVAGAELVGPLPAELQNVIIYAPGVSPRAPDAQAATHFLAFMRDAQAKQLMRAKGLDPA
ncbi:MAG TPA: substrate-binding domain-containing protein [Xanthobacteraceae bacterium]|nr:substrate-binding domain-containing protein [Xanthobacteraceae bacterium]